MAYQKNTAGQEFNVLAINTSTGLPITGDAANITAKISNDSGAFASVADTNPTELDATNAAGVYVFDLSQAETNGNVLTIVPVSTTANVQIDMLNIYTSAVKAQLDDIEDKVGDIDVATTTIESKTSQLTFTVANQVDANSLTGGTSAAAIYTYFTDGSREDVFKADVSVLNGSGSISYPVTVKSSGTPVAGVECWVSTDSAGSNVVAGTLTTDDFGVVTFLLDAGTYYLWRDSTTHSFPKPTTITVS